MTMIAYLHSYHRMVLNILFKKYIQLVFVWCIVVVSIILRGITVKNVVFNYYLLF